MCGNPGISPDVRKGLLAAIIRFNMAVCSAIFAVVKGFMAAEITEKYINVSNIGQWHITGLA